MIQAYNKHTLYEALNPLILSKDYLNPFYFQSHTLAFHSQLQHVIPLPCINCVTHIVMSFDMLRRDINRRFIIIIIIITHKHKHTPPKLCHMTLIINSPANCGQNPYTGKV